MSGFAGYSALKAAWHTDRIEFLRRGEQIAPIELQLILSDYCNQDCFFCAYRASNGLSVEQFADEAGNKNPKRMIPKDKAEQIIRDAYRVGTRSVIFTGGGEPTAHPHHMELFTLAQSFGLDCGLNTNGIIFRMGWEAVLPKFKYVRFSIDAGTPDEYAKIRRSPPVQYGQALGNILRLRDECERQGSACVIGAGYVVTPDNWESLSVGVRNLRDAGCHYVRLACMQSTEGRAPYGILWDKVSEVCALVSKNESRDGFQVINLFDDRLGVTPDYSFCGMQQFVLYIGANLKTYRCCYTAYTKHGETGDLSDKSLRDWLLSPEKKAAYSSFDARSCSTCALDDKNRTINYMLDPEPTHVNFV
jgi:MoaA/NifB/PqqE/SkfB family radical SAM enzyme